MAVTVRKRPQGHILSTTLEDALVTDDYSNQGALFDNPNHGLVDGDYIYVTSDIENYNGFWYVEQINSRFFWLREYATGSLLQWVVDGTVNYYKATSTHGWSCVHLPILYTLSNNRWPTNSIDTARTISNVTDNDGFCELTVSGDIKSSGSANELDYLKVSTGTLAGIYQIIQWVSDTNFVINVAYTAANDTALTSATIQYYYNNYNIRVRVFAGLSSSHYWTTQKPYAQIVDLKLIPDDDGIVEVNINEFLKSKLKPLSNNTQLATLPNDIDSFCEFYISTAETYDTTDGEVVTTSTPSFTADSSNFEGVAVNSMLQFKNRYSGYLSEYLANNSASKFLTLFDEPRLFIGKYFDIGFLLPGDNVYFKTQLYKNSVLQSTSNELLPTYDLGLYRKELSIISGALEDRVDVSLYTNLGLTDQYDLFIIETGWSSLAGTGTGSTNWNFGTNPPSSAQTFNTLHSDGTGIVETRFISHPVDVVDGALYPITLKWQFSLTVGSRTYIVKMMFLDDSNNILYTDSVSGLASVGSAVDYSNNFTLVGHKDATKIAISCTKGAGSGNFIMALGSSAEDAALSGEGVDDVTISETKTINIDSECSFQDIYLTWKNYLGDMDKWKFTAQKDYIADVSAATDSTQNIFPTWPNSYGEFADTIDRNTSRTSRDKIVVRSQNVTEDELNAIRYIVSSPLVQIMVSKNDRRTVKVSTGSFAWKRDEDKLYSIEFEISYTNTIPSQSL